MFRAGLLLAIFLSHAASAFMPLPTAKTAVRPTQDTHLRESVEEAAKSFTEPGRNPDKPELPEIPGDYDWDAKYAGDADWQTENVPGKIVINDIDLARQATALTALEEKWRKERVYEEYEGDQKIGFVGGAEMLNGRAAMFFLVTGLLTEYWTGISIPGQIEEMLRITGVIGFEG